MEEGGVYSTCNVKEGEEQERGEGPGFMGGGVECRGRNDRRMNFN